jgi:sulfoxide reductase catalytic subunit YedY
MWTLPRLPYSEITPENLYLNRRHFIKLASGLSLLSIFPEREVKSAGKGPFDTAETPTTYKEVTSYNNFYEFGTDKGDPARNSRSFKSQPWKISVEGLVKNPRVYALEELTKGLTIEDRVYRMRCVEGWSMVIPWQGFQLSELIKRLEPVSQAKFVEFQTLLAPDQFPEQRRPLLDWPYVEGLRMDEALNPLTILAGVRLLRQR